MKYIGELDVSEGGVNAGRKLSGAAVVVVVGGVVGRRGEPMQDVKAAQDAVQSVLVVILDARQLAVERTRFVTFFFAAQQTDEHGNVRQLRSQVRHRRRQLATNPTS